MNELLKLLFIYSLKYSITSFIVGIATCAPSFVTVTAATLEAKFKPSIKFLSSTR